MQDIVICESDASVLAVLRLVLEDEGSAVTTCATSSALLLYLRLRALRATVLFDHYDPEHQHQDLFLTTLVNDRLLQHQHASILMTTNPLSEATQGVLQRLHISIVYKPFEIEDLLTTIRLAPSLDMPTAEQSVLVVLFYGPVLTLLSPGANCVMPYFPVMGELPEVILHQPRRLVLSKGRHSRTHNEQELHKAQRKRNRSFSVYANRNWGHPHIK